MTESQIPPARQRTYVSPEVVDAIVSRHGLHGRPVVPIAGLSSGNTVYLLGDDLVLRIPHDRGSHDFGLHTIATAISVARSAGVRTPQILVLDDTRDLLPVPYMIVERVHGEPLSKRNLAPKDVPQVWRDLGRDLALLHYSVSKDGPAGQLESQDVQTDPRPWLEELASDGLVSLEEAVWLRRWLDELQPLVSTGEPLAFCHGDVNADNILVAGGAPHSCEYLAIVDWDGAGWLDPAWDFVPVSLRAVPIILQAYREIAEVPGDSTIEARILWHHVQYSLHSWRGRKQQGRAIVEGGLERLRLGIDEVVKLPGARWMAYLA